MTLQRSAAVVVSLLISLTAAAQTPTVEPGNKVPDRTPVPTITFTVVWPGVAKPQHYSLKIELSGRVTYISPDDAKDAGHP